MARKRRGRGEGSVYQRADWLYIASVSAGYDAEGKRVRLVAAGTTKAEALQRLRELQEKAAKGILPDAGVMAVKDWLSAWLEDAFEPEAAVALVGGCALLGLTLAAGFVLELLMRGPGKLTAPIYDSSLLRQAPVAFRQVAFAFGGLPLGRVTV